VIAQIEQQKVAQLYDFVVGEVFPQLYVIGLVDGVGVGLDQIDVTQDRLFLVG
jgi:hypothetical protein